MTGFFVAALSACNPTDPKTAENLDPTDSVIDTAQETTEWPRRVTLITPEVAVPSDGLDLATGASVEGDGDLRLYQGRVISLLSPGEKSICVVGTFERLEDVPTDECPADSTWAPLVSLGGASFHTEEESYSIGISALVWDATQSTLYRLRVEGDSYTQNSLPLRHFRMNQF